MLIKRRAPCSEKSQPILWGRGLAWLALLAPFFFITYNYANQYAAALNDVPSIVFWWEPSIPLMPWTIVPYWSIDLLYGLAFLLPRNAKALDTLGLRLLTAQVICISCFMLWPLHFSFVRPELSGVFGSMFDILMGFDKPFNQAPSLHITLMVVLWACYSRYLTGFWRTLSHVWFALIGVSVLTTWQHHFIDVPTGLLAGLICLWCWPIDMIKPLSAPRHNTALNNTIWQARFRLAAYYLVGALILVAFMLLALSHHYFSSFILLWPITALLLVSINYGLLGVFGFQKRPNGQFSVAAYWLLMPYWLCAKLNSRIWTYRQQAYNRIYDNIYLGRLPDANTLHAFQGALDLCAELPLASKSDGLQQGYQAYPSLDLVPLSPLQCWQVGCAIERLRQQSDSGKTLVYCALGYSRSATAVMAWLLIHGHAHSVQQAMGILQQGRPQVVLKPRQLAQLERMCQLPEFERRGATNKANNG